MADKQDLTTKQRQAIAALLTTRNIAEAAKAAKVGERTLYRWMTEPAFRAELASAEGDAIDQATRQLLRLQGPAIAVFAQVLGDKENPAAVRLRAAQSILDSLLKIRELRNTEQRLAELEAAVYGKHQEQN